MASSSSSPSGGTDSNHKIGPYTLTKEIGKGSFAVVYQAKYRPAESTKEAAAESTRLPSKVAIKIVTRRKLTPKLLENLEGEISILRAVRHVNIVELLDCLKTSTHIYLVMQYCKMGDLSNYIRTRRRATSSSQKADVALANPEANAQYPHPLDGGLNADVTRNFLAQLAAALQFMRGRNIVHRDIKPQNLLLQEPEAELIAAGHPPQIPQVKVADFGFARHLEAASLAETLCGSPLYMAPEILRYEKYDAKADLWSVGAVLYEMCVGKPPFRAVNHVELLRRIEKGEDKVKFPDEKSVDALRKEHERRVEDGKTKDEFVRPHIVDEDLKGLIRQLLKRKPIERMTFESLFNCNVIQSVALPGAKELQASASSLTDKATPVATRVAPAIPSISRENSLTDLSRRREKESSGPTEVKAATATRSYFKPKYVVGGGGGRSTMLQTPRQSRQDGEAPRTPSQEHPSEAGEASSLEDNVLETPGSSVTHLPSTARPEVDRSPAATPAVASSGKVSRGQSSLTEDEDKGYVIVEKRTVEVNALADELADAHLAKTSTEPRGPWGALGVVRRPSRLGRIASGLGATAMAQGVGVTTSTTPPSPGLSTSSSPTSPRQAFSTQRILQASPTSSTSPKLASPPLNAPFAIPLNARRPSFNRRSSQSNDGIVPRLTAPSQSQMGALVPSSAPTITGGTSGSPLPYSGPSAVSSSALARAISMASIRLFGVPTGMSLRSANVRRSLRMGLGTGGYLSSSPGNAIEYHGLDAAEQNLLNLIHDYGQKSFVLSEFADAKLSLFFSEGPHQGNYDDAGRQGNGSGSSSSVNVVTTGRYGQAPVASYGSLSSEVVAAEALVLYVKSLSFLQRGIDATKDYIEARTVRYASPFQPGAEINDAVQWLRAKFNDGYERANFARSKACEEMPDSAQHVDKMIFDKALEIARGAALDELGSNRAANEQSWHADKCLLAYETASSMLLALLDPGEEAMELSEASAGTVEKFVKSIHKRMANLQRSQEGAALATGTEGRQ